MVSIDDLKYKYRMLAGHLDERALRRRLGADALCLGYGGASAVAGAAGVSRTTVHAGMKALGEKATTEATATLAVPRIRKPGGGRKAHKDKDAKLLADVDRLLDPVTRGDPMAPLRWTAKSTTKLAEALRAQGHPVSQTTVRRLLGRARHLLQSNRKSREGTDHPDRNEQFEYIGATVKDCLDQGLPVISVDTQKKELVGRFKNGGKEWRNQGRPVEANLPDFADRDLGKAIPYGVYDIGRNEGWGSVGVTHDTAEFAVATIRRRWLKMGRSVYPEAREVLIAADGGGSNGWRVRPGKRELHRLADDPAIAAPVRHFPPGTGKWNKIEHRRFCHIAENWRARPPTSVMTIVNLIGNTRTQGGLSVQSELDESSYETGKKIGDDVIKSLAIARCDFHGEWNYSVAPRTVSS
ncbi:MAG: ISAzo13 family transposase [Methylococcales bacterium]